MKAKEVHKLKDDELRIEVDRLRRRVCELRTQAVTEKIEDTSQFSKIRKDVARLLTEQSARRLRDRSGEPAAPAAAARRPTRRTSAGRSSSARKTSTRKARSSSS